MQRLRSLLVFDCRSYLLVNVATRTVLALIFCLRRLSLLWMGEMFLLVNVGAMSAFQVYRIEKCLLLYASLMMMYSNDSQCLR
jgi:hypothetical protein